MSELTVVANRARCKSCKDLIHSKYRNDFVSCACGMISIDGGIECGRVIGNLDFYENMAVFSDESFELIRTVVYRGTRGKDGDEPLTWVRLCDMGDEHLVNTEEHLYEHGGYDSQHYKYILQEIRYRGLWDNS